MTPGLTLIVQFPTILIRDDRLEPIKPGCECVPPKTADVDQLTRVALTAVTRALSSIGRAFLCLDLQFRIVHASRMLDKLLGEGASERLPGRPITELLGDDLF